jgi:hypothetical protein
VPCRKPALALAPWLLAAALLSPAPATARAADVSVVLEPAGGVRFGAGKADVSVVLEPAGGVRFGAGKADVSVVLEPAGGVRFGAATTVRGTLTEVGAPLARQPVVLEARRFPFAGTWEALDEATTDTAGAFVFARELDRNHQLRVRHEPTDSVSTVRTAFVYPSFTLAFEELEAGTIRVTQLYRVPSDVRLTARTRFYIGPQSGRRARLRATVPTRRVRAGRYRAVARVRIPECYGGRFR